MKKERMDFRMHVSSAFLVPLYASGGSLLTEIFRTESNMGLLLLSIVGFITSATVIALMWKRIQKQLSKQKK